MMGKKIAIIGGGPAGCICAYFALKNPENNVTVYDFKPLMSTVLPTGNGRCNLAYGEFDFKELAKFYPRGEKFLYSVFSRFSTVDTLDFFEQIGIKTYMQNDLRYFPVSNSSKEIQKTFISVLNKHKNFKLIKEKISNLNMLLAKYDAVVVATGGNEKFLQEISSLGIKTIPFKQSLVALKTNIPALYQLAGVSFKNVSAKFGKYREKGDILIAHDAITGPLIYKISSLMAFEKIPYNVYFNFTDFENFNEFDKYFENLIKENKNKDFVNIISQIVPYSFADFLLVISKIPKKMKANQITKICRKAIAEKIFSFNIEIISTKKHGETVKAGGVDTDFINPKNMQSKLNSKLYFIGEVLNVDGFCGGFNLQNCWSTGAICGQWLAK